MQDLSAQAHILLVDDDDRIRSLLQKYLIRNGYLATTARDATHARRLLEGLDFDLAVLDVMMPGEDGMSLCKSLKEARDIAIILLTAKGETSDRIAGLEAGADDYLAKPFEPKELLLRISAIMRRQSAIEPLATKALHLGQVRYDIERGEMWEGDAQVRLTATEGILMKIFTDHTGQTVSRSDLVERLARNGVQSQERAVDVQITRLRKKIEQDPKKPRFLQTVRGLGYMLTPE